MAMLLKLFMSFGALLLGTVIGAPLGWNIGKLFRKDEEEDN